MAFFSKIVIASHDKLRPLTVVRSSSLPIFPGCSKGHVSHRRRKRAHGRRAGRRAAAARPQGFQRFGQPRQAHPSHSLCAVPAPAGACPEQQRDLGSAPDVVKEGTPYSQHARAQPQQGTRKYPFRWLTLSLRLMLSFHTRVVPRHMVYDTALLTVSCIMPAYRRAPVHRFIQLGTTLYARREMR